ncbi:MAG TPA: HTTM domain-containing protein [Acidobacteriaceae bacterium]|nr:HTTM domain-containing protein [Acidobacteriaceae bacterium]
MILERVARGWYRFFFAPQSPLPIALFRILYGLCVTATLLLLHGEWLDWYGVRAWVGLPTMQIVEPGVRLNLFTLMPQNDRWIAAFFWVFLAFAVLLTIGLWTRISSIAVFLCLTSIQQRNLYMLHSGDTFLRVAGFFLMFAPAGAALSLDRRIRIRRRREGVEIPPRAPWAQRMIQFELALLYLCSFLWKLKGHAWLDGTALYYVTHLHEVQRFPVPGWMHHPAVLKLGSWFTLALEFALGVLIWFRPFRYPLLCLGLLFHLCLEYALNIPMFQWDVLAAYVLFVDPADLTRAWKAIQHRFARPSRPCADDSKRTVTEP